MRTFVAVDVSDQKVIENVARLQSEIKIGAKPTNPEKLHFTLQFLGEIPDDSTRKVIEALNTVKFSKFKLEFQGIGAFPKPKSPRVVWVGTDDEGARKLINLAKTVEDVLEPLGFKNDRQFKPHITVFRVKNKIGDITRELGHFESWNLGEQVIERISFNQSVLTPSGPIYSNLEVIESA